MRILTPLAQPGLVLVVAVSSRDGKPLMGKGTRLARRHLRLLHDEGVRVLHVQDDRRVESWEQLPDVDGFIRGLDERFAFVEDDPLMGAMKQAIKNVYLEFLFEMED